MMKMESERQQCTCGGYFTKDNLSYVSKTSLQTFRRPGFVQCHLVANAGETLYPINPYGDITTSSTTSTSTVTISHVI